MVNDFWLKNKHTISIFQAQVRDLAKHIEAQPKKHNAYKKKNVYFLRNRRHSPSQVMRLQVFSYEICEIFNNTYFEEHLQTTAFSSSSFKLDLVDLTAFPDLNLRQAKIKPFTTVCISKLSRFCSLASSFLRYQVRKLLNFVFSFIFNELTSK